MNNAEALVSIIMPCYNAERYLEEAIKSVIEQVFKDWELIIVNDGSTDRSEDIARIYQGKDSRIRVENKQNGGYVSARLHGLNFISNNSRFLQFFDADDKMHPEMLSKLYELMIRNPALGAVYCNHTLIDPEGKVIGTPDYGVRLVPTLFGVKKIKDEVFYTSFISIFCWASRMIEPMTLIRKEAYEMSAGWDSRFGKGRGNIGDGVLLFSEIALTWKAAYLHEYLYFYRKHPEQATADPEINRKAGDKVIAIWEEKIKPDYEYSRDIKAAIIVYKYRIEAYKKAGSLKYYLRFKPLKTVPLVAEILYKYLLSLQLVFYKRTKVFNIT
jgi:glycosyltransferase involved in cell wall biosynthesis